MFIDYDASALSPLLLALSLALQQIHKQQIHKQQTYQQWIDYKNQLQDLGSSSRK